MLTLRYYDEGEHARMVWCCDRLLDDGFMLAFTRLLDGRGISRAALTACSVADGVSAQANLVKVTETGRRNRVVSRIYSKPSFDDLIERLLVQSLLVGELQHISGAERAREKFIYFANDVLNAEAIAQDGDRYLRGDQEIQRGGPTFRKELLARRKANAIVEEAQRQQALHEAELERLALNRQRELETPGWGSF